MFRRLPLLTVLLVVASVAFAALIVREITRVPRGAKPRPQPSASVAPPQAPAPAAAAPAAPPNYTVVASRNLFSPSRTEAPPPPPAPVTPPAPVLPKPNLYGVVLLDGTPVAYLEDPVSKRVARYRVGDHVAGGTVQTIGSDTVTLTRPEGQVMVRLHDPTRPRPAAPAGTPGAGAPPGAAGAPVGPVPQPPGGVFPEGAPPQSLIQPRRPTPGMGRTPPQPTDATPR